MRRDRTVRCAIYTRKSSEEGLEQEFNSLQAQREACEAFINSQRHEGWVCLRAAYDDGGFSGATMDRPALQQLLADVTQCSNPPRQTLYHDHCSPLFVAGRFAADSALEEAGFELPVPPERKAALDRFRRPSVTRRQA
jgi:Resolvase, N terminal domain